MSRKHNLKHQHELETFRAGVEAAKRNEPKWHKDPKWVVGIVVVVVAAVIGVAGLVYIQRPEVETVNVGISCAICDDPSRIRPPTSSQDYGATLNVKIQNSGLSGTTVLDHNVTFYEQPDPISKDFAFQETADPKDNISFPLGSHSVATLSIPKNEAIIYFMRYGRRPGSSISPLVFYPAYLFGHVTYVGAFNIHKQLRFCFQYRPPQKGLPEGWGVCQR
jgi:hypothetical protein